MPAQKEAWWVCVKCNKPISKVGKKSYRNNHLKHLLVCPNAGYQIERISQNEIKKEI